MKTIHLHTIIENKLFQRGQFLTFPVPAKMEMLEKHDIGMVVNLWSRPDPELHMKSGLIYIHWPIGGGSPPYNAEAMIDLIESYMCSNVKVLVHCEAGVNRSVWLCARLLAKHEEISGEETFNRVTAIVNTRMRPGLMEDLLKE